MSTLDLAADVEIALDPPVSASAPGSQPAVAFDGTSYFVVWNDFRTLRSRLYGARMAADGTVLDPFGILLDDSLNPSYPHYTPAVAFDGTSYLVTFLRNGTIVGLRVSPESEVLDASPFPISTPNTVAFGPRMAFDGENHLLVWSHQDRVDPAATGIYVARVSPDGTVLDPGGVLLIPLSGQCPLDVAFDGENYFLSWVQYTADQPMVMGAHLTTAGALLEPEGFPIQQRATDNVLEVSFDGTNHVVVWSAYDDEEYNEFLYATRVTPEGTVLEPSEMALGSVSTEGSSFNRVAATATSAGTIVASSREGYTTWQEIHLALVPVQGDAVLLPPKDNLTRGVDVALATGGDSALALWMASFSNPNYTSPDQRFTPIVAQRLRADATSLDAEPFFVSRGASAQDVRAVASDGQSFFVLWTDSRDPATEGRSLYGARVSADGTVLDPAGILVTQEEAGVVGVVFDGTNYLVIFVLQIEGSDNPLRAVRVSPQGQVLDTLSIELPLCSQSPSDHTPRAAAAGDRMLLVANGCDFETLALAAVVIDRQGAALSTPAALVHVDDRSQVNAPEVASDGTGYLVVWHDNSHTVYGRRVDAAGIPIGDAFPITSVPGKYIARAAVRFGNGHYHVVWQRVDGIFGARVDIAGQVLDPDGFPIISGQAYQGLVFTGAVAFRGENLVVAYQQVTEPGNHSTLDIHATEVGPTGAMLSRFPISAAAEPEGAPALAANDAQQVLAAYTRFVAEEPLSAYRARARLLVESAEPGPDAGPGTLDAGPGTPDAGPGTPDAGNPPGNPGDGDGGGCGCAATPSPGDAGALVLLALGLFLALRRRHDLNE